MDVSRHFWVARLIDVPNHVDFGILTCHVRTVSGGSGLGGLSGGLGGLSGGLGGLSGGLGSGSGGLSSLFSGFSGSGGGMFSIS